MPVTPCEQNEDLRALIEQYAEALKVQAHALGDHGLSENDFYQSGVFRGAIERIRGQFSAAMRQKREFVANVLNHMQDRGFVADWISAGGKNRHDYTITLPNSKISVVELKGCLDGNNTNIFERPPRAVEFIIWSICSNEGADPRRNVWSGIHTRLSAEIISRDQRVDGLVVWDWKCGMVARPCPKILVAEERVTELGAYRLPPPCIYMFAKTVPSPRNNPSPSAQDIENVGILKAMHECFGGRPQEINHVRFSVAYQGAETVRRTEISRGDVVVRASELTPIRRA